MIGNPVSFPKVRRLVEEHFRERFAVVEVTEQEIMDAMLTANRHGHVICTQGGEGVAGLRRGAAREGDRAGDAGRRRLHRAPAQVRRLPAEVLRGEPARRVRDRRRSKELQNRPVDLPASATAIAEYLNLARKQ